MPEFNQDFCDKCGAKAITECPSCKTLIRGHYTVEDVICIGDSYDPPAFCYKCGTAFPWTTTKISAAVDLLTEDDPDTDPQTVRQSIEEIVSDTPRTKVGATRLKNILTKVGSGTAKALRELLVDIASESAKKIIWGK